MDPDVTAAEGTEPGTPPSPAPPGAHDELPSADLGLMATAGPTAALGMDDTAAASLPEVAQVSAPQPTVGADSVDPEAGTAALPSGELLSLESAQRTAPPGEQRPSSDRGSPPPPIAPSPPRATKQTDSTTTPTNSEEAPPGSTEEQVAALRRQSWPRWAAVAAVLVGLALLGSLGLSGLLAGPDSTLDGGPIVHPRLALRTGPEVTAAEPTPTAPTVVERPSAQRAGVSEGPAVAAPSRVQVVSTPPGAVVLNEQGNELGETPLELPRPATQLSYTLRLTGHTQATVALGPGSPPTVEATLSPTPARPRRAARKPRVGSRRRAPSTTDRGDDDLMGLTPDDDDAARPTPTARRPRKRRRRRPAPKPPKPDESGGLLEPTL